MKNQSCSDQGHHSPKSQLVHVPQQTNAMKQLKKLALLLTDIPPDTQLTFVPVPGPDSITLTISIANPQILRAIAQHFGYANLNDTTVSDTTVTLCEHHNALNTFEIRDLVAELTENFGEFHTLTLPTAQIQAITTQPPQKATTMTTTTITISLLQQRMDAAKQALEQRMNLAMQHSQPDQIQETANSLTQAYHVKSLINEIATAEHALRTKMQEVYNTLDLLTGHNNPSNATSTTPPTTAPEPTPGATTTATQRKSRSGLRVQVTWQQAGKEFAEHGKIENPQPIRAFREVMTFIVGHLTKDQFTQFATLPYPNKPILSTNPSVDFARSDSCNVWEPIPTTGFYLRTDHSAQSKASAIMHFGTMLKNMLDLKTLPFQATTYELPHEALLLPTTEPSQDADRAQAA